jgi:hypothetical protein
MQKQKMREERIEQQQKITNQDRDKQSNENTHTRVCAHTHTQRIKQQKNGRIGEKESRRKNIK